MVLARRARGGPIFSSWVFLLFSVWVFFSALVWLLAAAELALARARESPEVVALVQVPRAVVMVVAVEQVPVPDVALAWAGVSGAVPLAKEYPLPSTGLFLSLVGRTKLAVQNMLQRSRPRAKQPK